MTTLMRSPVRPNARGFTLIETMVTISIVAILLAVVVPSMRTFTYSQRVKTSSFDMFSTLSFARSEAIKRRVNIAVQPVSTDWKDGWTVTDGTTTLRSQEALKGIAVPSPSPAAALTYRLDGRLTSTADVGILLAANDANSSVVNAAGRRCISVDPTGVPRSRVLPSGGTTCP